MLSTVPAVSALRGNVARYLSIRSPLLSERVRGLAEWSNLRLRFGVEPFSKSTTGRIGPEIEAFDRAGRPLRGINFASQDYLSLSSHPEVIAACIEAAERCGVHSAGSPALMGNTADSLALEQDLAEWLGLEEVTLFPTGWGAGFGAIKGFARASDHVLLDELSHACLFEGARAATSSVATFAHLDHRDLECKLRDLRSRDARSLILVVTESLFSMDSDTPDLRATGAVCHEFDATLLVDVAHDLGALGPSGRGVLERQLAWDCADLVVGSFSKTFAANGGFIASRIRGAKLFLRYTCGPHTFSNAPTPLQVAAARAAVRIARSAEGDRRREALMRNVQSLRKRLEQAAVEVLGQASAIVPMILGPSWFSRLVTRECLKQGAIVNLVEFPAVAVGRDRLRLQVMAEHREEHIDAFARILCAALEQASRRAAELGLASLEG